MAHKKLRASKDDTGNAITDAISRADGAIDRYVDSRKKRKRTHTLRVALAVVLITLICLGGAAFAYINSINAKLASGIDDSLRGSLTQVEAGQPFYMLLLGVDKDQDRVNSSEYGAAESAYRTDSIMLVRVDPKAKRVTLVSIHRDTLVDLGEYGQQKINAAYSVGGPSYTVKTISEFAGVPISHYAELDFDNFVKIVDAIGGVEVDVPVKVDDSTGTGKVIEKGKQTLNGDQALVLCRARHAYDAYGDGDRYRAANQRMVISAIAKKILTLDPASMATMVSKLADSVTTDLDATSILTLATQFRGIDTTKDIYSGMEPTNSEYVNSTWYEICDKDAWQKMMQRVDKGLSPYESEDEDTTRGVAGSVGSINNGDNSSTASATTTATDYSGTVLVLNAANVNGLAGRISASLNSRGFECTASTANSIYDHTVVVYNGNTHKAQAQAVNQALGGNLTVKANDGQYSTDADVVLVLGTDQS